MTINGDATGTINLQNLTITGNLTVNTPGATVVVGPDVTVTGLTTITDVASSTFVNKGTLGAVKITDSNGTSFVNDSGAEVGILTVASTGDVKITATEPITNVVVTSAAKVEVAAGTITNLTSTATGVQLTGAGTVTNKLTNGGTLVDKDNNPIEGTVSTGTEAANLKAATDAVVKAEASKTEVDVEAAGKLVRALKDGEAKTSLQNRLAAIDFTAPTITNPKLALDGAALLVSFSINEEIDLATLANVELSYFTKAGETLTAITNSKVDGVALVKDKTWDGYLANVNAPAANYSTGTAKNDKYSDVIVKNTVIGSKLQKGYQNNGEMDYVEIIDYSKAPGTYVVVIKVTDNVGHVTMKTVELTVATPEV